MDCRNEKIRKRSIIFPINSNMNDNYHNYFSKLAILGICLSMTALSSCSVIEMRDVAEETTRGEANTAMMLAPAERTNEIEIRTDEVEYDVVEEAEKTVISLTATGDIRIDESIIADAANRASEGSTYSFLKIYSGVYRVVHDADVAVGKYSAAASPYNCSDETQTTPIESLAALTELGFEALDTTGIDFSSKYESDMEDYGIVEICPEKGYKNEVCTVEKDGVVISFVATDGSVIETTVDDIEYADSVSDVVVVSANWQHDASYDTKKSLAETMAKAGADVIIGSGDTLEGAEWIDGEGRTLVAYSLGNFVATDDDVENLCGGILSLDITLCNDEVTLENVCIDPIIVHYNENKRNYQVFELSRYTKDISATHGIGELDIDSIKDRVSSLLNDSFLPSDFKN